MIRKKEFLKFIGKAITRMNINVLTIFPEIFEILNSGVISKAMKKDILSIKALDIRKNTTNKHKNVDSKPYGGGEGMVIMAEPLIKTIKSIDKRKLGPVIYMSPQGQLLTQKKVISLSKLKNMTVICGRYEGIDQRVIDNYVDEEVSIGDFILSGGEYAAICLIDAISRHLPGTLGNKDSYLKDTFSNGLLKEDVYAKPEIFDSNKVPEILLSGNHEKIKAWKSEMSLLKTFKKRPDLLKKIKKNKKYVFSLKDIIVVESLKSDGVQILRKYQKLYDYNNNLPSEINTMIVNGETGLVLLKISEIIGEDNLEDLGIESVDYIVSILNELKLVDLRNEILLKVLPLKV